MTVNDDFLKIKVINFDLSLRIKISRNGQVLLFFKVLSSCFVIKLNVYIIILMIHTKTYIFIN